MNIMEPLIVKCEIGNYPRSMPVGMLDSMPKVPLSVTTSINIFMFPLRIIRLLFKVTYLCYYHNPVFPWE